MRIKQRFNPDKIWFTSDNHFYHSGILGLMNRPFESVEYMNQKLIDNWNYIVPKYAIVFCLGDFAFTGDIQKIKDLVSQLNGVIYLIMGNHDYQNKYDRPIIQEIFGNRCFDVLEIEVQDNDTDGLPKKNPEADFIKIFMSHYPHYEWNRGAIHTHGHVHSKNDRQIEFNSNRYDVGVDNNDYSPISYHELKNIISYQNLNLKRI